MTHGDLVVIPSEPTAGLEDFVVVSDKPTVATSELTAYNKPPKSLNAPSSEDPKPSMMDAQDIGLWQLFADISYLEQEKMDLQSLSLEPLDLLCRVVRLRSRSMPSALPLIVDLCCSVFFHCHF